VCVCACGGHIMQLDLHTWRGTNGALRLLLNLSRGLVFANTGACQHAPLQL
jgi:hypothetical protein